MAIVSITIAEPTVAADLFPVETGHRHHLSFTITNFQDSFDGEPPRSIVVNANAEWHFLAAWSIQLNTCLINSVSIGLDLINESRNSISFNLPAHFSALIFPQSNPTPSLTVECYSIHLIPQVAAPGPIELELYTTIDGHVSPSMFTSIMPTSPPHFPIVTFSAHYHPVNDIKSTINVVLTLNTTAAYRSKDEAANWIPRKQRPTVMYTFHGCKTAKLLSQSIFHDGISESLPLQLHNVAMGNLDWSSSVHDGVTKFTHPVFETWDTDVPEGLTVTQYQLFASFECVEMDPDSSSSSSSRSSNHIIGVNSQLRVRGKEVKTYSSVRSTRLLSRSIQPIGKSVRLLQNGQFRLDIDSIIWKRLTTLKIRVEFFAKRFRFGLLPDTTKQAMCNLYTNNDLTIIKGSVEGALTTNNGIEYIHFGGSAIRVHEYTTHNAVISIKTDDIDENDWDHNGKLTIICPTIYITHEWDSIGVVQDDVLVQTLQDDDIDVTVFRQSLIKFEFGGEKQNNFFLSHLVPFCIAGGFVGLVLIGFGVFFGIRCFSSKHKHDNEELLIDEE